jgi:hypothetical protein
MGDMARMTPWSSICFLDFGHRECSTVRLVRRLDPHSVTPV